VRVEWTLQDERLGQIRIGMGGHRQLTRERRGVAEQRVHAQRHLTRLVVIGHQRAGVGRPQLFPPHSRDPLRMGMLDRRLLRCLIAQLTQQCGALPRAATEHRVDQAMTAARTSLGQLDPIRHDRVVGRAVQVQQLVQPQPQRRQQPRIQPLRRAVGETLDQVVERALALHSPVEQAHRQRPVARVELLRLALQRTVGVGAVLEDPAQHHVGAATRGGHPRGFDLAGRRVLHRSPTIMCAPPWPLTGSSSSPQRLSLAMQIRAGVHRPAARRLHLE